MVTQTIETEAMRHVYLLDSDKLNEYEKQKFQTLLSENIPDDLLKNSIFLIFSFLRKHYNQKVIILIDEYDVLLSKAYDHGYYLSYGHSRQNRASSGIEDK